MDIRISDILFQVINFGILMFVFKKFLYKPILKVLDDRATRIKDGLEAAEKNIELQQKAENQKTKMVADAKKEAEKILKEAKKEAEELKKTVLSEAKEEAKKVIVKERQAMEADLAKQQADFQNKVVGLITGATKSVLQGSLSDELHDSIINEQIKKLNIKVN